MTRRLAAALAGLTLVVGLAACSGDDDFEPEAPVKPAPLAEAWSGTWPSAPKEVSEAGDRWVARFGDRVLAVEPESGETTWSHRLDACALRVSPDGATVVIASRLGRGPEQRCSTLSAYDAASGSELWTARLPREFEPDRFAVGFLGVGDSTVTVRSECCGVTGMRFDLASGRQLEAIGASGAGGVGHLVTDGQLIATATTGRHNQTRLTMHDCRDAGQIDELPAGNFDEAGKSAIPRQSETVGSPVVAGWPRETLPSRTLIRTGLVGGDHACAAVDHRVPARGSAYGASRPESVSAAALETTTPSVPSSGGSRASSA